MNAFQNGTRRLVSGTSIAASKPVELREGAPVLTIRMCGGAAGDGLEPPQSPKQLLTFSQTVVAASPIQLTASPMNSPIFPPIFLMSFHVPSKKT
jgi:hypothetical protein